MWAKLRFFLKQQGTLSVSQIMAILGLFLHLKTNKLEFELVFQLKLFLRFYF